jgi:predicted HNH restriction endonuclease
MFWRLLDSAVTHKQSHGRVFKANRSFHSTADWNRITSDKREAVQELGKISRYQEENNKQQKLTNQDNREGGKLPIRRQQQLARLLPIIFP